ncbi:Histidine biosynthesis bifunctional protein HisIE [Geodia barretti]|uniref:Histidine biosynthesis bifunctional protein HisIE n=1 Tax=Geodia barretti TaxID=519541 RepID=A0AA35RHX4_GEOBA|nr:Histidine biosynthesis bifunctional protein HisIE [Geodia barretti]
MLGYMNPGSLKRTLEGTQVWFYSRSQEDLWHKGEVSGNYLNLREWYVDCDSDTILLKVDPDGPACHTGEISCFYTEMDGLPDDYEASDELFAVIKDRQRAMPEGSYTAKLLAEGTSRVAQKVIEEAGETALAAATNDTENPARGNRGPFVSYPHLDGFGRGVAQRRLGGIAFPSGLASST